MNLPSPFLFLVCLLGTARMVSAATLFEDRFDSDTSANWKVLTGYYAESATNDYTAEFGFDYSQQNYKRYAADNVTFEELPIPPSPNGNGTTRGLKLTVNHNDELAERFAINLFPNNQVFSNNYALKFDLWLNYNGPAEGGSGSTEHFIAGINHSGNVMNWHSFVIGFTNAANLPGSIVPGVGAEASDGIWVTYASEGGSAIDGRVAFGTTNGPPTYYSASGIPEVRGDPATPSGFLDRDGDNTPDNSDNDIYVAKTIFPQPKFETAGAPGKRWVEVEITQVDGWITWKFDGKLFAQVQNPTGFTSGNIMIGYMDIFTSIADPRAENFAIFDNVRVEPVRTVVVDTADNASPASDGSTSLVEALAGLQDNDRITFNISGTGPFVLATPLGGYPLITNNGVVIDGYSQPGASPNTNELLAGNNASIQIVLDSSSDAQSGDPALPSRASTRLPFPGFGDSENAILGIYEADYVTIRGLSFLGRHTPGSDDDPSIYGIALVKEARGAKVQGNWFGLAPDGATVKGFAAGVAAFRHRVDVGGENVDTFSGGLTVGTDSDGVDDLSEFNILAGLHIALALELPEAITSGNYFNVRPDGKTFLNVEDILQAQLDAGRDPGDSSVENYENGRLTEFSVIGVRGDGINDVNERNIFNFSVYDQLIEFYSNASNIVVAGNYFGVGVDGTTTAPVPTTLLPNLIELPGSASIRLGSDNDGVADEVEGNLIVKVPGTLLVGGGSLTTPIVARRNSLSGNAFEAFPFPDGSNNRLYSEYYAPYVADVAAITPVLTGYTNNQLSGTIALPAEGYFADVDIYLADPAATAGVVIPGTYLGTFFEDGPDDLDPAPGQFTFNLGQLAIPGGQKLCVVVTYSANEAFSAAGTSVTGPASNAVETGSSTSEPIGTVTVARDPGGVRLSWLTGVPPFQVQRRTNLVTGTWENVGAATSEKSQVVPITGTDAYFRVQGQ